MVETRLKQIGTAGHSWQCARRARHSSLLALPPSPRPFLANPDWPRVGSSTAKSPVNGGLLVNAIVLM